MAMTICCPEVSARPTTSAERRGRGTARMTDIRDAINGVTGFSCDPNGNLPTVTDAENHATTYTYDNMDRLKTRKDALPTHPAETYDYDAAGNLTRFVDRNGQQTTESLAQPIDLGPAGDAVYLILYGSGLGNGKAVTATIGGVAADVAYAGPQGEYLGLDQFNVLVPRSLAGRGRVEVVIMAEGRKANAVAIEVK